MPTVAEVITAPPSSCSQPDPLHPSAYQRHQGRVSCAKIPQICSQTPVSRQKLARSQMGTENCKLLRRFLSPDGPGSLFSSSFGWALEGSALFGWLWSKHRESTR